tara:strand:+ start:1875 stop:2141 length:267 start_codon:yes stop_codon:yes gene_type:complete
MNEPKLVEYDKLFKKKTKQKIIKIEYPKIDYWNISVNILCFIVLFLGIYILYQRKENKQINKLLHDKKVYDITKEINDKLNITDETED